MRAAVYATRGLFALALWTLALAVDRSALADAEPRSPGALSLVEREVSAALGPELALERVRLHRPPPGEPARAIVSFRTPPRPGVQTISVVTVDAGGARSETWAELRLARVRRALVAARPLAVGDTLGAADARPGRVVGGEVRLLELAGGELEGARVLAAVEPGAPIPAGALELAPPLPRGAPLRVLIQVGGVAISAEGTLERPARAGEPAAPRLAHTARIVTGRLADRATLVVEGGRP